MPSGRPKKKVEDMYKKLDITVPPDMYKSLESDRTSRLYSNKSEYYRMVFRKYLEALK